MNLSRYVPVEHPLALQFQRAVESLTAAQVWDSARQYRGTARDLLIYLGENHPDVTSLNQLHRDPHILGWFAHLRSLKPAVVHVPEATPALATASASIFNRASNPENRCSVRLFFTASDSAFDWPISITNCLPRVTPVYTRFRCKSR